MWSSVKDMASPSSLFSTYASISASIMLFRSMVNEIIPGPIRDYLLSFFRSLFNLRSQDLTLIIEEDAGIASNELYKACETYLCTKISPETERLKVYKIKKEKGLTVRLDKGEKIQDSYEGIELQWRFLCSDTEERRRHDDESEKRSFELSFEKKHREAVMNSYLPFVLEKGKVLKDDRRILKMHTLSNGFCKFGDLKWDSINLEHPSTFKTMAMEEDLKKAVIDDLDRFIRRKKFYKRVGRAWKRGYLLYGPPGTGKSSLVAAMANHLKFDVYDLQLSNIVYDSDLRKLLLTTANRSILVIEDIDCSLELSNRRSGDDDKQQDTKTKLTLSGLLNFIDGLWSACGDERIIVFTTNHKERLDPALLRPGRMDMHIHMSYCTYHGFKTLASNYLELSGHPTRFEEIEELLKRVEITPAQVAEELMKSDDIDVALEGLIKVLNEKNLEANDHLMNEVASNGTQEENNANAHLMNEVASNGTLEENNA